VVDSLEREIIAKPALQRWGKDVTLVVRTGRDRFNVGDDVLSRKSFAQWLGNSSGFQPWILEERLLNHEGLNHLSSTSLNTVRIMTCRCKSGRISVFGAALRFSANASIVDNWPAGGLAAAVDVESGKMRMAMPKAPGLGLEDRDMRGLRLPDWTEAKTLAVCAHERFGGLSTVGWDVGLTPSGPVLVEGNDDWDIVLPQRVYKRSLWQMPSVSCLAFGRSGNEQKG